MTPAATSTVPPAGGLVYDGRWTCLMIFLLKALPVSWCVVATSPIALVFYLLARPQGHAVRGNLSALFPHWGPVRRWVGAYRVFQQFALTYVDRICCRYSLRKIRWTVIARENFERLRATPGGVLVFSIHSGNYDIAATLLADDLGRPLHTVRVPERTPSLEAIRMQELASASTEQPLLRVHYNKPGGHLGIDLCRLLLAGEIVAVQGDRVLMDVAPLTVAHEGVEYTIPLGPLMLAETARVPCHPIFMRRLGACHYEIEFPPPFYTGETRLRRADLANLWLPVMTDYIRRHWDQWFVFEPALRASRSPAEGQPGG